ncbi:LCP family protein [Thermoleophilia bacterium SCSIO 60948]|nr:LCP family protein [Thermoleophilia bacterium SCSIO 60948]
MRPFDFEDDERDEGAQPGDPGAAEGGSGDEEEWQPATWAGRRGSEPEPQAASDAPDAADESPEPPDEFAFSDDDEADDAGGEEDEFGDENEFDAAGDEAPAEPQPTGGNTLETDTVAEADREQARESALSGLRARAAESAARRGGSGAGAAAGVGAAAAARSKPAAGSMPPPSSSPAARIGKTSIDPAAAEQAGPPGGKPPSRRSLWARFAAASAICIFSMAAATAISVLVLLTNVAEGLGDSGELANLGGQLAGVDGGDPQTILILGSDKRTNTPGDPGRSDTTILLRVDPDKQAISLLSIPRDLQVEIPGYEDAGETKFNEAYTLGGPELTLRTVKSVTGLETINHVVNIDFNGFADAVNEIGCVYIDADRRYFVGENDPRDYSAVNIKAGYQRMCGFNALGYVRYRIGDDDLVRAARQQEFLREARQKVPPEVLFEDREDLLQVFTDYTTSDINSGVTLLEFLKTLLKVGSAPINEVHFPATPDPEDPANLVATSEAIETAVDEFMVTEGTPGPPQDPAINDDGDGGSGNGGNGGGGGGDGGDSSEPAGPQLIDSSDSGLANADLLARGKFEPPIYYPTRLLPESSIIDDSRWFPIDGPSDELYYGYKFVVMIEDGTTFPRYYGVSGTTWKDAPILENPSEEREIEGRDYKLYYDGDRLRMIAFETEDAAYWVSNTLTQELTNDEMIAIATGLQER